MVETVTGTPAVIVGGNDWSIVGKKFVYGLLAAFASIGIPYTINFLQTEDLSVLPVWFIGLVPVITGILLAIQNAWVHREKVIAVDSKTMILNK